MRGAVLLVVAALGVATIGSILLWMAPKLFGRRPASFNERLSAMAPHPGERVGPAGGVIGLTPILAEPTIAETATAETATAETGHQPIRTATPNRTRPRPSPDPKRRPLLVPGRREARPRRRERSADLCPEISPSTWAPPTRWCMRAVRG